MPSVPCSSVMAQALESVDDSDGLETGRREVVRDCAIAFSVLSGVGSLLVMFLVRKKGDTNTQVTLIWWMSLTQLLYDASFVPAAAQGGTQATYLAGQFLQNTFGLLSSFITNVIAGILYYVIAKRKAFDLQKYWMEVCVLTYLPVLLIQVAVVWAICTDPEGNLHTVNVIYYWMRVISIVLNFALCSMAYYQLIERMTDSSFRTYTDTLLRTLIKRTAFYPIVQAVTRLPACYYEYEYGWRPYVGEGGTLEYIEAILWVVFTPSAGVGYLAIYLISAPGARQNLNKLLFVDTPSFLSTGNCSGFLEPWDRKAEGEQSEEGLKKVREFNAEIKRKSSLFSNSPIDTGAAGRSSGILSNFSEDYVGGSEYTGSVGNNSISTKPSSTVSVPADDIPDSLTTGNDDASAPAGPHNEDRTDSQYEGQGQERELLRHLEELEEDVLFETMRNIENLDGLQKQAGAGTGTEAITSITVVSPIANLDNPQPVLSNYTIGAADRGTQLSSRQHESIVVTSFSLSSSEGDPADYYDA